MAQLTKVPVTPAVLRWAIDQSGYKVDELALTTNLPVDGLRKWMSGRDRPSTTELRSLAAKLHRPFALFLLPRPPATAVPHVDFRSPPGKGRRHLNPTERQAIRQAARLQRAVAWAEREMGNHRPELPRYSTKTAAESAAATARGLLGIRVEDQAGWESPSEALSAWRQALEELGVLVFLLPMGKKSCRGFSIWDDGAPAVAANTWWNTEARIYSLLHEFGHLITRTSSACLYRERPRLAGGDEVERWCEEFAAAVLLPRKAVERLLLDEFKWSAGAKVQDLRPVVRIARRFHVSLRAAALRLIRSDLAEPALYGKIPAASDTKRLGGGGGGRQRPEARREEYGPRTSRVLLEASTAGVFSQSDLMDYLHVSAEDLHGLAAQVRR